MCAIANVNVDTAVIREFLRARSALVETAGGLGGSYTWPTPVNMVRVYNGSGGSVYLKLQGTGLPSSTTVGDFSSGWTAQSGWTADATDLSGSGTAGALVYGSLFEVGVDYRVKFTVSGYTSGDLNVYMGDPANLGGSELVGVVTGGGNGTYEVGGQVRGNAGTMGYFILEQGTSGFTGNVDNVVVESHGVGSAVGTFDAVLANGSEGLYERVKTNRVNVFVPSGGTVGAVGIFGKWTNYGT